MKKFISLFLVVLCLISILPISASATTTKTITSFGSSVFLTAKDYYALKNGKIGAEKKDGKWYYTFTCYPSCTSTYDHKLYVLPSAFKTCGNKSDPSVNKSILKGIQRTDSIYQTSHYYCKTPFETEIRKGYHLGDIYKIYIDDIVIQSMRDGKQCIFKSYSNGGVMFNWVDKMWSTKDKKFVNPTTSAQWVANLTREVGNAGLRYTPKFVFSINKPGDVSKSGTDRLVFADYACRGTGYVKDKNLNMKLFYYTGKFLADAATGSPAPYDLLKMIYSTIKKESTPVDQEMHVLSCVDGSTKRYYTKVEVTSPFSICRVGAEGSHDYVQLAVRLSKVPAVNKAVNTEFGFSFTVSVN